MKFRKTLFSIALLVSLVFTQTAEAQQIKVLNSSCTGTSACLSSNQAQLAIDKTTLTFDPNDGNTKRRFQAFWITGDGNYLQFKPEDDAASMAVTYNYPLAANFEATAYLTGKYTDRKPPARAVINIPIGNIPTISETPVFSSRLGKLGLGTTPVVDVFSNHAIRRKYLTTFVLSWPANVQATGVYFFFNGYQNHVTGEQRSLSNNLIHFSNVEIPKYFDGKMDATKIKSTSVLSLRSGAIPGLSFNTDYASALNVKYNDVLYFPPETATSADMPRGFSENRYFPVVWTDSLLVPDDTLLNFYVLITSDAPISSSSPYFQALDSMVRRIDSDLGAFTPLAFASGAQGQGQPQYVVAVNEYQLPYLATFDPNQLTVEKVQKLGADEYEVTFNLEMCNKGRGDVFHEKVNIGFSPDFHGFQPIGFTPEMPIMGTNSWSFGVTMTIPGVDILPEGQHEESSCERIKFIARTNCEGLRSLWKGSETSGVSACVVFDGAMSNVPECHGVTRIDSTQYQENGNCLCCRGPMPKTNPIVEEICKCGVLCFLLLAVLLLVLLWWFFKRNN